MSALTLTKVPRSSILSLSKSYLPPVEDDASCAEPVDWVWSDPYLYED